MASEGGDGPDERLGISIVHEPIRPSYLKCDQYDASQVHTMKKLTRSATLDRPSDVHGTIAKQLERNNLSVLRN